MAELIAQGKHVGATWSITAFGPWLDVLQMADGKAARNNLVRTSLVEAGQAWAAKFLGRRFTNYVRGAPFFYSLGVGGAIRKFRRMGLLKPLLDKEFMGWDPWSPAQPPRPLIEQYRRMHPEVKGAFSRTGNFTTLSKTIRRQAKEIVYDMVRDTMNKKLRPLVETGETEKAATTGYRVSATATGAKQILRIAIPLGGPRNAIVGQTIRTMPDAEVSFVAKTWAAACSARLRGKNIGVTERGGGPTFAPRVV